MGTVHEFIRTGGKRAALDAGLDRGAVEAATSHLSDADVALGFAYFGWAQCAQPHKRLHDETSWSLLGEKVHLAFAPGRRPGSAERRHVGMPFGAHARLILFSPQTAALRTGSREVGNTGWLIRAQAERARRARRGGSRRGR